MPCCGHRGGVPHQLSSRSRLVRGSLPGEDPVLPARCPRSKTEQGTGTVQQQVGERFDPNQVGGTWHLPA